MRRLTLLLLALAIAACTGQTPNRPGTRSLKRPGSDAVASAAPRPAGTRPEATPTPAPPGTPTPGPTPTPRPTATPATGGLGLIAGGPLAGTWLPGPSLNRPRAGLAAGVIAGKLFAFEGENRPSLEALGPDDAWVLDAGYDGTLPLSPAVGALGGRSLVLGVTGNTGVVLAGGQKSTGPTDQLLFYDEDGLAGLAGSFGAPVVAAAGGKVDGHVAAAGGLDAAGAVTDALRLFDLAGEVESAGATMPLGVAGAAGAVLGGKLYVLGGYTLDGEGRPVAQSAVQVYDPLTDSWRFSGDGASGAPAALPAALHSAAATVAGGKLYLVGGAGSDGGALASGWSFEPATDVWTAIAPLPTARALHALVAFEGALWAIGGFGPARLPLTTVEVFHP